MDDDNKQILLGLAVGVAIVGAAYVVMQNRQQHPRARQRSDPALVQHNVIRDDQGRIQQVETFRGLQDQGAAAPAIVEQGPAPAPAPVEEEPPMNAWNE